MVKGHWHKTETGALTRCYHEAQKLLLSWQFWAGTTFSFPLEHLIWEKMWPFKLITKWMGL